MASDLMNRVEEKLRASPPDLSSYEDDFSIEEVIKAVQPCVCCESPDSFEDNEVAQLPSGSSKVGGLPDLPAELQWPEGEYGRLSFIAQINLEEIKPFDLLDSLPTKGMFYLFCYADGDMAYGAELDGEDHMRLLHSTSGQLRVAAKPADLEHDVFPECPLVFQQGLCVVNAKMSYDIKDAVLKPLKDLRGGIHFSLGQPQIFSESYRDHFGDDEELLFFIPAFDFGIGELGEAEIYAAVNRAELKKGNLESPNLIVVAGS